MRVCPGSFKTLLSLDQKNIGIKLRDDNPFGTIKTFNLVSIDVPLFQRLFCWPEKLLEILLADLMNPTLKDNINGHNIGKIILCSDNTMRGVGEDCPEHMICIDGQQRLTTATLLLVSLRDHYSQKDTESPTEDALDHITSINSMLFRHSTPLLISSSNPWQGSAGGWQGNRGEVLTHPAALFRPSHNDRLTYFRLLLGQPTSSFGRDMILRSKEYFDAALASLPPATISLIHHNLLHQLRFMVHELTEGNPNEAFMGTYTTGEAVKIMFAIKRSGITLAQSDIVRNMLLMKIPLSAAESLYYDTWLPIESSRTPKEMDTVLRAFLHSKLLAEHGPVKFNRYLSHQHAAEYKFKTSTLLQRLQSIGTGIPGIGNEFKQALARWDKTHSVVDIRKKLLREFALFVQRGDDSTWYREHADDYKRKTSRPAGHGRSSLRAIPERPIQVRRHLPCPLGPTAVEGELKE
eukprot:gnl/Dysnectes_brevis/3824_a4925_784.p1 GENE.gnl/Dysnectes_brevis/3824_a4925_784~~gnl/Dysnectes_brevis/3824_a4925_784.p1  ORF type:complete len:464 (+),score=86.70 gnl/Dysnectes_brevis/3824_a4925_784:174-1565(+)